MIFAVLALLLWSEPAPTQGVMSGHPVVEGGPLLDAFNAAIDDADSDPCDGRCLQARKDLNVIFEAAYLPYHIPCEGSAEVCAAFEDTARDMEKCIEPGVPSEMPRKNEDCLPGN